MKVGILTFHYAYNYGAVLQAWGLQQAIETLGHEVCFINYIPPYMRNRVSPFRGWGLRSGAKLFDTFAHRVRQFKRRKGFSSFVQSNLNVSAHLKSERELCDFCEGLDAVVVGSDQVWNLSWLRELDETYFLGFLKQNKQIRKIAYGACFGQLDQPKQLLKPALDLIKGFDAVGMRNEFGLDILSTCGGIKATQVVDPAFFIPVDSARSKRNEVSIYAVDQSGAAICQGVANQVSRQFQAEIMAIDSETNIAYDNETSRLVNLSPEAWLDQLSESSFICSESFHGAVFALANQVPFVCASVGHRSYRVDDLIKRYGQSYRNLSDTSEFKPEMCALDDRYYSKLKADIAASMAFLKASLS
jgi:polysaccharide pyruvyl transferase WcaK-like protein